MTTTQSRPLYLAELLENNATIGLHLEVVKQIRQLHDEYQKVRDEAYQEGYSQGLYAARNALNERFGL